MANAKTVTNVTTRELLNELALAVNLSKKETNDLFVCFTGLVTKHLKKGDKVKLQDIGILQVRARPARMGRNPATGEAIKIKASRKVSFRPSKILKEAIL